MGLLEGKTIFITGIITDSSIGFHVAKEAQDQGATVIISAFGRMNLVNRIAKRLPKPVPDAIELDVTNKSHMEALSDRLREMAPQGIDGAVHSIAFAPPTCFGENFFSAPWDDVAVALNVSAYSYSALAEALQPVMKRGGSYVGLDFDPRMAQPFYNWMGVSKATLESVNRYVARALGPKGIRSNLVAAGPVRTLAAKAIAASAEDTGEKFSRVHDEWNRRAPLGWDPNDGVSVAKTVCALLSDFMPLTTASVVYADGGAGHAIM